MNAKGKIKMFAIIGLVALIAVGSTLAYLSSVTETKTNVFTSDKEVTANITETEWNENESYIPGEAKAKNPVIENLSKTAPMYTGVKIEFIMKEWDEASKTYVDKAISYQDFKEEYGSLVGDRDINEPKDGINDEWAIAQNEAEKGLFVVYGSNGALKEVGISTSTTSVFDEVLINIGLKKVYNESYSETKVYPAKKNPDGTYLKDENGNYIPDTDQDPISSETTTPETSMIYMTNDGKQVSDLYKLPEFDIKVTGYAVQTTGPEGYDPSAELLKLAGF